MTSYTKRWAAKVLGEVLSFQRTAVKSHSGYL